MKRGREEKKLCRVGAIYSKAEMNVLFKVFSHIQIRQKRVLLLLLLLPLSPLPPCLPASLFAKFRNFARKSCGRKQLRAKCPFIPQLMGRHISLERKRKEREETNQKPGGGARGKGGRRYQFPILHASTSFLNGKNPLAF